MPFPHFPGHRLWVLDHIPAHQEKRRFYVLLLQKLQQIRRGSGRTIVERDPPHILVRTLDHVVRTAVLARPVADPVRDSGRTLGRITRVGVDAGDAGEVDLGEPLAHFKGSDRGDHAGGGEVGGVEGIGEEKGRGREGEEVEEGGEGGEGAWRGCPVRKKSMTHGLFVLAI